MMFRWILVLWMCGCSAVKTHHKVLEHRAMSAGFGESTLALGPHRVEQAQLLGDIEAGRERYAGLDPAEYENSLVIWGEHDRVFPVAIGRQLSELLGAEFVVIEGTAHAPHIERPRQVNSILVDFLGEEATGG
jgi:pimeloyl-ACP methyl ester carboxylesterase